MRTSTKSGMAGLTLLMMFSLAAQAASIPMAAATVSCGTSSSGSCSLYMDLTGDASANQSGADAFSYQTGWRSTSSLSHADTGFSTQNNATANVSATGFATFGALKSELHADATGSGTHSAPHASALTDAYVAFQDRLTFTGAPVNSMGTMVGVLKFSGGVSGLASTKNQSLAYGYSMANASVNGITLGSASDRSDDQVASSFVNQSLTFTAPIKFGVADFTSISARLWTEAKSNALSGVGSARWATADTNFFQSLEWERIDAVLDAQGHPITGWSVTSASGFDYTRRYADQLAGVPAVPEPSGMLMMMAGLGILGAAYKRNRT